MLLSLLALPYGCRWMCAASPGCACPASMQHLFPAPVTLVCFECVPMCPLFLCFHQFILLRAENCKLKVSLSLFLVALTNASCCSFSSNSWSEVCVCFLSWLLTIVDSTDSCRALLNVCVCVSLFLSTHTNTSDVAHHSFKA